MTAAARARSWRDEAAAGLVRKHLPRLRPEGPALVALDPLPDVGDALEAREIDVERWHRRAAGGRPAAPWPPDGPFGTVLLRLPRAKDELEMAVHAAASVLAPGGLLLVHGANDEGVRSAPRRIEPVFGAVRKVASGGRCRLLRAERPVEIPGLRGRLEAWRETFELPLEEVERRWVSYPGVFAHGRLDPGTRLLVEALPAFPEGARILDFGCGSGIVGAVAAARTDGASVDFLDVDAVALEAVRENVPGARTILGDGVEAAGERRYRAIVSNPPYHAGKREKPEVVKGLIAGAPDRLEAGGELVLVVQRRLPVEGSLRRAFGEAEVLADADAFRVWRGRR